LETTLGTLAHILQPGIQVKRIYRQSPLVVSAAGTELNQVWTNLIRNAVDAMLSQGELRLTTFCDDNCAVVEIGDSGSGIPAEIKLYIFDPFFTTKGVGEGTGLGLSTVQTIVRKLGGNIQVASKPSDTRFQVWLPRVGQTEPGNQLD
ncbi:MAG: ATP-binding protein, partial [Terracidiphilus sp.]